MMLGLADLSTSGMLGEFFLHAICSHGPSFLPNLRSRTVPNFHLLSFRVFGQWLSFRFSRTVTVTCIQG